MSAERRMHCGNYFPHEPHRFRPRPDGHRYLCGGTLARS